MTSAVADSSPPSIDALPRTLPLIETLGFGLTGLLLWIGVAPGAHAELGQQAMWVWVPGAIFGIIINLQVRHLGQQFPAVVGGTPNYLSHLLPDHPWLTRYAAYGYFFSWVAVLPVNAIILADLITTKLTPLGLEFPVLGFRIGILLLAFLLAFNGSRALSTLHLIFLLPAVGLLLTFCIQGTIWMLAAPPSSIGVPDSGLSDLGLAHSSFSDPGFSLLGWAKWYLSGTYAFYACETASAFVADSKNPRGTLKSLTAIAALIPIVYIVGSWLLLHSPTSELAAEDAFLTLSLAAAPFWGSATSVLVTFLVVSSCLLSLATAVSITPRILYQLARDQHIAPVFGSVTPQGVFAPGLGLTLLLSLGCLVWGNLNSIVMITGVGWLTAFVVLHWGLWQRRGQPGVSLPWLALSMAVFEGGILLVGGWSWGANNLIVGLLLPFTLMMGNQLVQRLMQRCPPALDQWPQWLSARRQQQRPERFGDFIALQVGMLVGFVCVVAMVSWFASVAVVRSQVEQPTSFLVMLILMLSFLTVAIACWTLLPKMTAVNEARAMAESRSAELQATLRELQQTQMKMVQQEKLSGLGQLVAGIAHEINNPVNFIHGNLQHAQEYAQQLLMLTQLYQQHYPHPPEDIQREEEDMDLDFLVTDFPKLLNSMSLGTDRIREIVLSLRNFSRADEADFKTVDIHEGLESTLLILKHRLKAEAGTPEIQVERNYQTLPSIQCYPGQLNQVFMNILSNGIDAVKEKYSISTSASVRPAPQEQSSLCVKLQPCKIVLHTRLVEQKWVEIEIADSGLGIPQAVQSRIFDPFFTTKEVGKGTGLGMSISHQIITELHRGQLTFTSLPDVGTLFNIRIPIQLQPTATPEEHNDGITAIA